MTPERFDFLVRNHSEMLTEDEVKAGWHFCYSFDGMLIHELDEEYKYCECGK